MNGPENLVGVLDVRGHVRERLVTLHPTEVLVDPDDDVPIGRTLSKAPKPVHGVEERLPAGYDRMDVKPLSGLPQNRR